MVLKDPLNWCKDELDNLNKHWECLSHPDRREALYIISLKMWILDSQGMAFDVDRVKKVKGSFESFSDLIKGERGLWLVETLKIPW